MRQLRKLLFLTDTRIPSTRASAIHVRKLLPELGALCDEIELLSNEGDRENSFSLHENIKHHTIRLPSQKGGLYWMLWLFRKRLRNSDANIIYSRFVLLPLIQRRTPYLIELHDDAWNKGFLFKLAMNRAVKDPICLGFVTITDAIRRDLFQAYPNLQKSVEVIEDAAAHPPSDYSADFPEKNFLNVIYVGSFHKGKGLEVVMKLAEKTPQHKFTVIGGSESQVKELSKNKTKNLLFEGFVDHDDIWKYMKDVDVCLLPNQPDVQTGKKSNIGKYTSPLKMFEYMSYAKPTIASNLPVIREILDDQIAIFAEHDRLESWVEALDVLSVRQKRYEMGSEAYKRFVDNHTWSIRAKRIFKFILSQDNVPENLSNH